MARLVNYLPMLNVHRLHVINPRLPHPLPARSLLLKMHDKIKKQRFAQFHKLLKRKQSYSDDVLLLRLLQLVKNL